MALSNDLISEFVKVTKDDTKDKKETTVYGTAVVKDGVTYVKLDGSELLTPISSTADAKDGERVSVLIKNHTATINGNRTSPAARKGDVDDNRDSITEMDNVLAYSVTADNISALQATLDSLKTKVANIGSLSSVVADIETLYSKVANLDKVNAKDVTALNAEIANIQAQFIDATGVTADELKALNADIATLKGYTADFTYVSADRLTVAIANIKELDTKKLSAEQADLKYANIDFTNIGEAAVKKIFSDSGIINDLVVSEGKITGELVGVTIKGDIIEGGTVKADKLVVKGSDGLFYKLNTDGVTTTAEQTEYNSLNGTVITAKSITAEKVAVDDLVAFGATIGGFHITDNAIYSGVKETATNTTRGAYLDSNGQLSVGDASNFLRYYMDEDGNYKLEISASSLKFSASGKTVGEAISEVEGKIDNISVGGRNLLLNSGFTDTSDYWTAGGVGFGIYNGIDCAYFSHAYGGLTEYVSQSLLGKLEANKTYTLSGNIALVIDEYAENPVVKVYHNGSYLLDSVATDFTYGTKEFDITSLNNAGWTHFTWQFTTDDKLSSATASDIHLCTSDMSGSMVYFYNLKLETGNIATDWSPAPEDISAAIDDVKTTSEDAQSTAEEAYALASDNEASITVLEDKIIKVVVDENGESRLVQTANGWSFDIGDYQKKVGQATDDVEAIKGDINALNGSMTGIKTYVRVESENGQPVLKLGADNNKLQFDGFEVVITNTDIKFKEGDETPAYISNKKLNIDTAQVNNELQFGGFAWIPHGDGNMGVVWKGVDA